MLEIGCSDGLEAYEYSPHAWMYVGVDISDEGIKAANERGLSNAEFLVCDAHSLPFSDNQFDAIIVNSLLHHLDLEVALTEIYRVLKPSGLLIMREPLNINPLWKVYRALTPGARTEDELPFVFTHLKLLSRYFDTSHLNYFGFFSLLSPFLKY